MSYCATRRGGRYATAALSALLTLLLSACANNSPRSLYAWGDYPDQTYHYLKGEESSYHEAIQTLEEQSRAADADRHDLPPGFRAYLGLLYLKNGQPDKAVGYFQEEKAAFPESSQFMDFQLSAFQKIADNKERKQP